MKKMKKGERTKTFIVEKSAAIINKKGMAGTSISDIMEATKLAKGGIYGNFESKDEIYTESFFYLINNLSKTLDTAVSQGRTAKERLYNLLDAYNGTIQSIGGCPILNFGVEADDTDPNMKLNVKKTIQSFQKRIFDIIAEGIAVNEISKKMNAKSFSIKVFAMIEGGVLCKKVFDNDNQMKIILDAIKSDFEMYLV